MGDAIYRKYRPMTFADVTDQNHVKMTIQNQIGSGTVAHAYLFMGPRGVGKTTIARLLAKTLNCENRKEGEKEPCNTCASCLEMNAGKALDIIEIDAASHTGVDSVRETIIESVRFAPTRGKYKVFIIDEVHMLSTSAFNALLKTLEEPPKHALFVLATTEIHKIPQTILSRCQRFDFHRIANQDIVERLKEIGKQEGVQVDEDVLKQIARLSEGCLRDAESLFGQVLALGEKEIGKEQASIILPVTNTAVVADVTDAVVRRDPAAAIRVLNGFVDQGGSVKHLTDELIEFARTMLMLSLGGPYHDHYDADVMERMRRMLESFSAKQSSAWLDALLGVKARPTYDALPHLPLEVAVVLFCEQETNSLGKVETGGHVSVSAAPVTPKVNPSPAPAPKAPVQEQQKPAVQPQAATAAEPEAAPEQPLNDPNSLSIEDLKSKWKRCCEAVSKKSIALPLALQAAEPLVYEDGVLQLGFGMKFHFDNMNQPKNLKILADAIREVMLVDLSIKPIFTKAEEEAMLGGLAEAFGGQVID